MTISYYTVTASLPGEPSELVTTIASGPAAAVSAVTNMIERRRQYPAHVLSRARFACRSGWIDLSGNRFEPRVDPQTARAMGEIA